MMTFHSDALADCHESLHNHGFNRATVLGLLSVAGISIATEGETAPAISPQQETSTPWPEWKKVMALLPTLSVREAAAAFSNVDLAAPGWLSDEEQSELSRWEDLLHRAIYAQDLAASASDIDSNGEPCAWDISHESLWAWCNGRWEYPLPSSLAGDPAYGSECTQGIKGATYEKLQRAIDAFPSQYPDYQVNFPPLDKRVRPWLSTEIGCDERERHVFGKIIYEHFGPK